MSKIAYKIETKTIADKEYEYVYCPKCEVGILVKDFNLKTGEHPNCEKYQKSKETRRRAERTINKLFGEMF